MKSKILARAILSRKWTYAEPLERWEVLAMLLQYENVEGWMKGSLYTIYFYILWLQTLIQHLCTQQKITSKHNSLWVLLLFSFQLIYNFNNDARTGGRVSARFFLESAKNLNFWKRNLQNRHFLRFLAQFD